MKPHRIPDQVQQAMRQAMQRSTEIAKISQVSQQQRSIPQPPTPHKVELPLKLREITS